MNSCTGFMWVRTENMKGSVFFKEEPTIINLFDVAPRARATGNEEPNVSATHFRNRQFVTVPLKDEREPFASLLTELIAAMGKEGPGGQCRGMWPFTRDGGQSHRHGESTWWEAGGSGSPEWRWAPG